MASSQQARELGAAPNSDSNMSVKRNMKALDMDIHRWEDLAQKRSRWRQEMYRSLRRGEKN